MKKLLAVLLSVMLIFSLTACNNESKNNNSDINDAAQSTNANSVVSEQNKSDNTNKNSTSGSSQSNSTSNNTNQSIQNNSSQNSTQTSSNSTATNNNNTNQSTQNSSTQSSTQSSNITVTNTNSPLKDIDNGVLENATAQEMNVPVNIKLFDTNDAKEENNSNNIKATGAVYQLDGDVVNWITENDLIYVITSGNNRLVVINSKTMMAVSNVPLAGKPAEINLIGDKIYISLPDLCRIDIFSKSSFGKISSLYFEHEISSFCIDGDYIYYSEHDQHCDVFRKNMTTNELIEILPDRGHSFYFPKLYLNKQDNILYIGETNSTGCALFYYDATTLQLKSMFRKNEYGISNGTREIFHIGNEIFWGSYRFSDTNANQIIGRYGNSYSVNFVSNEIVSTFEGVFLTDTYECIVNYFDADFDFEYLLVTKSYNVFFRSRSVDKNVIIGVNFSMQ